VQVLLLIIRKIPIILKLIYHQALSRNDFDLYIENYHEDYKYIKLSINLIEIFNRFGLF
jgi:hypothetical protein